MIVGEFVRREEFSEAEYGALGKFLVAVTSLDDVVGRASMKLLRTSGTSISLETLDEKSAEIVRCSGNTRLRIFEELMSQHKHETNFLPRIKPQIDNLLDWRNALCHGRYSRGSCGSIRVEFFDKKSVKYAKSVTKTQVNPDNCFSTDDLAALSDLANQLSFAIQNQLLNPP